MRRRAALRTWSWLTVGAACWSSACAGASAAPAPARAFQRDEPSARQAAPPQAAAPAIRAEPIASPAVASDVTAAMRGGTADDAAATRDAPAVADEAALRHALATAEDPTDAALELVAELTADERWDEALVVLDTAIARHRAAVLRVARAGVLRDLGRRHLAVAELRSLRRDEGAAALHPSLLFELAELEWLEGDVASARVTFEQLVEAHGDDAWTLAHREQWQAMQAAVARGARPAKMRARDLLGNLRGAPLATERIAVLEQLHAAAVGPADAQQELRERAIAIAIGDDAAPVRARAVQLADPAADWAEAFCRAALADESPLVRAVAAAKAAALLGPRSAMLLLEGLAAEQDPPTFVAMHGALLVATGAADPSQTVAATTAAERADVVARWRTRLSR